MPETVAYELDAPGTLWILMKNGERRRAEEGEIVRLPTPPIRRQTRAA